MKWKRLIDRFDVEQPAAESDAGYRITWCRVKGQFVFTAWAPDDGGKYRRWNSIDVFREGSNEERKSAAMMACDEHYRRANSQLELI